MKSKNETYTISMENVNLHFFIHGESFNQKKAQQWKKALHIHVYYEILFSLGSDASIVFPDREIHMEKDSFVIVPPHLKHTAVFEDTAQLFSIGMYYEHNRSKYVNEDIYSFISSALPTAVAVGKSNENLRELFLQLKGADSFGNTISRGFVYAGLLQILYSILAILDNTPLVKLLPSQQEAVQKPAPKRHYTPHNVPVDILHQVDDILNNEYTEDITSESISKRLFISKRQVDRYILSQYDQTLYQRRTMLRMSAAEKLLKNTDKPIGDISSSVGYTSINTFYSAFEKFFNVTPNQYRVAYRRGK